MLSLKRVYLVEFWCDCCDSFCNMIVLYSSIKWQGAYMLPMSCHLETWGWKASEVDVNCNVSKYVLYWIASTVCPWTRMAKRTPDSHPPVNSAHFGTQYVYVTPSGHWETLLFLWDMHFLLLFPTFPTCTNMRIGWSFSNESPKSRIWDPYSRSIQRSLSLGRLGLGMWVRDVAVIGSLECDFARFQSNVELEKGVSCWVLVGLLWFFLQYDCIVQ